MNEKLVRKYAYTIAKIGLNIQKDQKVLVESTIEGYEFANIFAQEAYKLGASEVIINYLDLALLKTKAQYQTPEMVKEVLAWQQESYQHYLDEGACTLRLEGVNPLLMEDATEAQANAIFGFVDNMRNIMRKATREKHCQWCIAMVPTQAWAEYILPDVSKDKALDTLWDILFKLCYIDETNDIEAVWQKKNERNREQAKKIDQLNLRSLHYTSSNGTDLVVGLSEYSKFAGDDMQKKPDWYIPFNPNIPTEEICTTPHKYQTNGVVYATKPLVLGGKKIDNFGLRFENGKVVEIIAKEGYEMLKSLIETDDGAAYLGECALVEYSSPISQSGIVYYTTLIDENASCHLALGRGLNSAIDGEDIFNDSSIHIDFMIGNADMQIIGEDINGNKITIFKDGDFAL